MEQATRKFSKLWWVTVTVAVLMALVFAVETPLIAVAESTNGGKGKYIKEMVMITASSKEDAESKVKKLNDDEQAAAKAVEIANALVKDEKDKKPVPTPKVYYLFDKPIYSNKDADGNNVQTYIAYTTTNNVKNSVKAIKSMYMKGGWSYEDYNDYLKQLEKEANFLAKDLYKAICEFATHLKAEKKNALYAKKILEFLYEDDSQKSLPDFFVDLAEKGNYEPKNYEVETYYKTVKKPLLTFMMQANKDILATVECALMIACKDSYKSSDAYKGEDAEDTSFLTGMQLQDFLNGVNGYKSSLKYSYLDVYVQDLLISLPDVQKDIRYYMDSPLKLTEDAEEMAAVVFDEALNSDPEGAAQLLEGEQAYLEELESEGPEEKQIVEEIESFDTAFNKLPIEEQNSYNNGKMYHDALKGCAYKGFNKNQYNNLLELFMKYEGTTEKISEQYLYYDFYPFLSQLSEGQRALLKVGLPQFLLTYLIPAEVMNTVLDNLIVELNGSAETEEEKIKKDDVVSVYKDVDRSLYIADNGIAMTSEAITAAKSKPLEHIVTDSDKASLICTVLASVAGGVAAASMITVAGCSRLLQSSIIKALANPTNTWPAFNETYGFVETTFNDQFMFFGKEGMTFITRPAGSSKIVEAGFKFTSLDTEVAMAFDVTNNQVAVNFTRCVSTVFKMGFGIALQWIMAVSIAVMIISIIIEYVYPLIAKEKDEPYIDIPRVMCSYEEVFGQTKIEGCDPVEDYIYYYGLKNPFLTKDDNKRANMRDGKEEKDTDILKFGNTVQIETTNAEGKKVTKNVKRGGIGDVANWTLKGQSRQWVAIYASTDSKSGKPILADSLTVLNNPDDFINDAELIPVIKFHENAPYNFNQAYAVTKNKNLPGVYLGYKFDNNAGTTTQTASVFSDISLWGGVVAGLVLGGGIGTLVTYYIIRKRKKKTV